MKKIATNFELYKDEILKITSQNRMFAKQDGQLMPCDEIGSCKQCDFAGACEANKYKWLYEERTEGPVLTKRERAFCEVALTGWISRDYNGNLTWRNNKPEKVFSTNDKYWGGTGDAVWLDPLFKKDDFWFIWWSDEKPWSIEDLLKLEVQE